MSWNQTGGCNLTLMEEVKVFHRVAYIPVFVMGFLLNSAAFWVFLLKRASWTETHVYMINLVVADFALIVFLPFRIYSFFHHSEIWDFCPFLISIHYFNMYASIFMLTAISVHRFLLVKLPFSARARGSRKGMAFALCIFIWVVVATICAIFSKVNTKKDLHSCYERVPEPLPLLYMLVLLILGFLIPCCTILFCTSQMISSLLKDKEVTTNEERRKCIAIITANLIVFIVCYTPFHIMLLLKFIVGMQAQYLSNCPTYNLMHNIWSICEWIATTNCCLDSIAYYFLFEDILH